MTTTLPPIANILSGYGFGFAVTPGQTTSLSFNFETSAPAAIGVDPTFQADNPQQQSWIINALASAAAVANLKFNQIGGLAQLNYGMSSIAPDGSMLPENTGRTQVAIPQSPVSYTDLNAAPANASSITPASWIETALHEVGNQLGLEDQYVSLTLPTSVGNYDYSIMAQAFSYAHNYGLGGFRPVTFQMIDIEGLQQIYGVNPVGYTGETIGGLAPLLAGTTTSLAGGVLKYSFTDNTAPLCVWVGAQVADTKSFDFSACTTAVTVNLNAGSFSSNWSSVNIAYIGIPAGGDNAVSIAIGTAINLGVANNIAGSSLIADSTAGHGNVLMGGVSAAQTFTAGGGQDLFLGGSGGNTVIFHDASANYSITTISAGGVSGLLVTDNAASPTDGAVVLEGNFTTLQFADKSVTEAAASGASGVIVDTAADVAANLPVLSSLIARGTITQIALSDGGIPNLSISAAELSSDMPTLGDISGSFTLTVAAGSASVALAGLAGHATTVEFAGGVSQYVISTANGVVSVTSGSVTDTLSNIAAIQFSDVTEIVAAHPGTASAVTTGNVTELYAAVLSREPDVAGLTFYQTFLQNNPATPLQTFAEFFLNSNEYKSNSAHNYAQSGAGDTQFIEDSYQNLLHRTPVASEVAFYENNVLAPAVANLTPGTTAYANAQLQAHALMLVYFSASPEFLTDVQVTAANPASTQHWLVLS